MRYFKEVYFQITITGFKAIWKAAYPSRINEWKKTYEMFFLNIEQFMQDFPKFEAVANVYVIGFEEGKTIGYSEGCRDTNDEENFND